MMLKIMRVNIEMHLSKVCFVRVQFDLEGKEISIIHLCKNIPQTTTNKHTLKDVPVSADSQTISKTLSPTYLNNSNLIK